MKTKQVVIRIWLLCVAMLPVAAQAQFTFTTNNGAITITGYTGTDDAMVIPGEANGLPVTRIGNGAFAFCGGLTSVTMPDSVTNLGIYTFYACSNLTTATISTNVTSIGASAFDSCSALTNVIIPSSVISIGGSAFQNCSSLVNVTIPNGVTNIGVNAFQYCAALTNVTIPASVTGIGQDAFGACGSLLTIYVDPQNMHYGNVDGGLVYLGNHMLVQYPAGRTGNFVVGSGIGVIGNFAFDSCAGLTNIAFTNYFMGGIGDWAFAGCTGLTGMTLLYFGGTIGAYAFESCTSLKWVTFSWAGTGYHSFDDCTDLTDVTIYYNTFSGLDGSRLCSDCPNLTSVYLGGSSPFFAWNPTNQIAAPVAYYLPGANPTNITGLPTALWLPQIRNRDADFGFQKNQFGFNINWAMGQAVVVEAATDPAQTNWPPLASVTLTNGWFYFSDPQWTNYPGRFYRVRWLSQ